MSNSNSDLVHTADTNSDSTTIRNSNESHNSNKWKRYAFIIGDGMLKKKTDGYLLTNSIDHKFALKTRVFPAAKREGVKDYIKLTKRDFDPDLCIFHAGNNCWILEI